MMMTPEPFLTAEIEYRQHHLAELVRPVAAPLLGARAARR